jgi:hypothetical protein
MNPCKRERSGLIYYSYAVYGCGKPHRRLLNPWSTHLLREQAVLVAQRVVSPSAGILILVRGDCSTVGKMCRPSVVQRRTSVPIRNLAFTRAPKGVSKEVLLPSKKVCCRRKFFSFRRTIREYSNISTRLIHKH